MYDSGGLRQVRNSKEVFRVSKLTPVVTCSILICSDRCFRGEREDKTGPALKETLERLGYHVHDVKVVPDELDVIVDQLKEMGTSGHGSHNNFWWHRCWATGRYP